jgi:hypothetical protein
VAVVQYTYTHKQYRERHKTKIQKTQKYMEQHKKYIEQQTPKNSAGRAPSLRVLPWHLPYNRGKSTEEPQSG